jgi:hypothetical protein
MQYVLYYTCLVWILLFPRPSAAALNKYESSIAISKSWKTELEREQLAVSQFQKRRVK